ncbi:hypothetical protein V1511DRAFT_500727 [Dipodascopsis uninucleata]
MNLPIKSLFSNVRLRPLKRSTIISYISNNGLSIRNISSVELQQTALPGKFYVNSLGGTFSPKITYNQMTKELVYLTKLTRLDKEELSKRYGSGRDLVSMMRIFERSIMEDMAGKTALFSVERFRRAFSRLLEVSLYLNNQYSLAMTCNRAIHTKNHKARSDAGNKLALLRQSNLPLAFYLTGQMRVGAGRLDDAIQEFNKCIQASTAHVNATEKIDKEFYDYDREVDFSLRMKSHLELGNIYEKIDDWLSARSHYTKALEQLALSKEKTILEVWAYNFLASMAVFQGNAEAARHFALLSAMRGNADGLNAITTIESTFGENDLTTENWNDISKLSSLILADKSVTIRSPSLKPIE